MRIVFRSFSMTLHEGWVVFAWQEGGELHLPLRDIFQVTAEPSAVRFEGAFHSVERPLAFPVRFMSVEANEICRVLTEELGLPRPLIDTTAKDVCERAELDGKWVRFQMRLRSVDLSVHASLKIRDLTQFAAGDTVEIIGRVHRSDPMMPTVDGGLASVRPARLTRLGG